MIDFFLHPGVSEYFVNTRVEKLWSYKIGYFCSSSYTVMETF